MGYDGEVRERRGTKDALVTPDPASPSSDEIRDFLNRHHPFDQLLPELLDEVTRHIEFRLTSAGEKLLSPGDICPHLFILHCGQVDIFDEAGALLAKLGEGDQFGQRSLRGNGRSVATVLVTEPGSLLLLPASEFHRLSRNYSQFRYFFAPTEQEKLSGAVSAIEQGDHGNANLLTTPVEQILHQPVISTEVSASVHEAARVMSQAGVSSLLVCEQGRLRGIVTDRDLRNRVLAKGLDHATPVREIMTTAPRTIGPGDYAYEALIQMARNHFHHLPVVDGDEILGMITSTDLIRRHSTSPLYVVGEVFKQNDVEGLVRASVQVGVMLVKARRSRQSGDAWHAGQDL